MARRRAARSHPRLLSDNLLVYGDNLRVLRESPFFRDESVDLVYLDPPFKHAEKYNVLFRAKTGTPAAAQVRAFEDTWHWDTVAKAMYHDVMENAPTPVRRCIEALKGILGQSDMFAYICMMAPRLVELHRVLRPNGSLYLHCDDAASHYLKMLLDAVFGPANFRNEITWKRTSSHSDAKRWAPVADVLLYYGKSESVTWNPQYTPHGKGYLASKYRHKDADGRRYRLDNMTSPNPRPNMMYEWKGHASPPKGWRFSKETMAKLDAQGRIWYPDSKSKRPQLKRYLDEMPGVVIGNVWTDIDPVNSRAAERLGYPTQKPKVLLERIIQASSNEGDVILDPFCGCGTTVAAAQSLKRKWMGIDVSYQAIRVIRERLAKAGLSEKRDYEVWGDPESVEDAIALAEEDKYQFEWWAVRRLGGREIDYKKGADGGVDGRLVLRAERLGKRHPEAIIQVKGGARSNRGHVATLLGDVEAENAELGVLVTRRPATQAMRDTASEAGEYTDGKKWYPRIQLLTTEDIINGKGVEYPASLPDDLKKEPAKSKRAAASKGSARQRSTKRRLDS